MSHSDIFSIIGAFIVFLMVGYMALNSMGYFRKKTVNK